MFICDKYYNSFYYKNNLSINNFSKYSNKEPSFIVHNLLFFLSLQFIYYFYSLLIYKINFYDFFHFNDSVILFFNKKSLLKIYF